MNRQAARSIFKHTFPILLALLFVLPLSGCEMQRRYTYEFYDAFDTVTQVIGYAAGQKEFDAFARDVRSRLIHMHQWMDIYSDYDDLANLKTVNDNAGIKPVTVGPELLAFILRCKELCSLTGGAVNITLGPVISLWNQARDSALENPDSAVLPSADAIANALALCNLDDLIIDEANSTLYLAKPGMSLDVGAIAKGYALEAVVRQIESEGSAVQNFLISSGGDVRVSGLPPSEQAEWRIGIQAPRGDSGELADTLYLASGSAVTSGDYQRYFIYNDQRYVHIIDPATGYPASAYQSVTVAAEDAALADALSTALFVLPHNQGMTLAKEHATYALWIDASGAVEAWER